MTGRTGLDQQSGLGAVSLRANVAGIFYSSPEVVFAIPTPTVTPTESVTTTSSATPNLPSPSATQIWTVTPTNTPTFTSTPMTPSATSTVPGLPTNTPTESVASPTYTLTSIPTGTPTSPATQTSTASPSETGTASATASPEPTFDPVSFALVSGSSIVPRGATVTFRACVPESPDVDVFMSFTSNNLLLVPDANVSPQEWLVPAGSSGSELCRDIHLTGNTIVGTGYGFVSLLAHMGQTIASPQVEFSADAPTYTPIPPTPTMSVASQTPTPPSTPTATSTAQTPTSTNVPDETSAATPVVIETPTLIATLIETSTSTAIPIETPTEVPPPTVTFTPSPSPTLTATAAVATVTATAIPDPVTMELISGSHVVPRGATVVFRLCLMESPATEISLPLSSTDVNVVSDEGVVPTLATFTAGSTGTELCQAVAMTGRTDPNRGIGPVALRAFFGSSTPYLSGYVSFVDFPPTDTPVPEPTSTETPSLTATSTPATPPTPAPTPTSTAVPEAMISVALLGPSSVPRGSTVTLDVCLSNQALAASFVIFYSSDELIVGNDSINPNPGRTLNPGECAVVSMTGRTFLAQGIGDVQLRAYINTGPHYESDVITFLPDGP